MRDQLTVVSPRVDQPTHLTLYEASCSTVCYISMMFLYLFGWLVRLLRSHLDPLTISVDAFAGYGLVFLARSNLAELFCSCL